MALKTTNKNRKPAIIEAKIELHEHNSHEIPKKCPVKSYHKPFFFLLAVVALVSFFVI